MKIKRISMLTIIASISILSGCAGQSEVDELKDQIVQLQEELSSINEECESLREERNKLQNECDKYRENTDGADDTVVGTYTAETEYSIDLDMDGTEEKIIYTLEEDTYKLYINDRMMLDLSEEIEGQTMYQPGYNKFAIVDMEISDSYYELAFSTSGTSEDDYSVYFYYHNNEIEYVGNTEGIPYSGGSLSFAGNGTVAAPVRLNILQTWWGMGYYELSLNHKLLATEQEFYQADTVKSNIDVELLQKLPAYESAELTSEKINILPMKGKITETDNVEWCKFVGEDGTEGWFQVNDFEYLVDMQLNASEVFEGLSYATD